jgi:AraC-like DNA-binding protein
MRLPKCEVRVWNSLPVFTNPYTRRPQLLIGDEERVSQILAQREATGTMDDGTKILLLRSGKSCADALPVRGVDQQLSVTCGEDELFDAVRRLSGAPDALKLDARRHAARGGLAPGALRRVREYIETHLAERITVAGLAAITGQCARHFARAFKTSVGTAPHRYIVQRRLELATRMVEASDRPLVEISHEVGFADQSHFIRLFVAATGETPRAWRRRCRPA